MVHHHSLYALLLSLSLFHLVTVAFSFHRKPQQLDDRTPTTTDEDLFKTNGERFKRGFGPRKPSHAFKSPTQVHAPHVPRQSGGTTTTVTTTGYIGAYENGVLQCYLGVEPTDCVPLASAQSFTYTYSTGSALGPQVIQTTPGGDYLAVGPVTQEAQYSTICPDITGDDQFYIVSSPTGPNSTPNPDGYYETDVFTIDPTTDEITAITWTNPPNSDCATGSPHVYLNPTQTTRPGRPALPRTFVLVADPTDANSIGPAVPATLAFVVV